MFIVETRRAGKRPRIETSVERQQRMKGAATQLAAQAFKSEDPRKEGVQLLHVSQTVSPRATVSTTDFSVMYEKFAPESKPAVAVQTTKRIVHDTRVCMGNRGARGKRHK